MGLFLRCYDYRARAKKSLVEHWPYYGAAGDAAALVHQARSLDVEDILTIANQIPNLDVPVRLVWGAADKVQGLATATGSPTSSALRSSVSRGRSTSCQRTTPRRSLRPWMSCCNSASHRRGTAAAWHSLAHIAFSPFLRRRGGLIGSDGG